MVKQLPEFRIVIPARYASERLPGKPLRLIHGKTMIEWVFRAAQQADASEGAPQSIVGFLLAVRDCLLAQEEPADKDLLEDLAKRAGLELDQLAAARFKQRLRQLIQRLHSEYHQDRRQAAALLGEIGAKAGLASPDLIGLLKKDENNHVRVKCAFALGQLRTEDACEPLLEVVVAASNKQLTIAAAKALAKLAPRGTQRVLSGLKTALGRAIKANDHLARSDTFRGGVAHALVAYTDGPKKLAALLLDWESREDYVRILSGLITDKNAVLEALCTFLDAEDLEKRLHVVEVLGLLAWPSMTQAWATAFENDRAEVRRASLKCLKDASGSMVPKEVVLRIWRDENETEEIRGLARNVLATADWFSLDLTKTEKEWMRKVEDHNRWLEDPPGGD